MENETNELFNDEKESSQSVTLDYYFTVEIEFCVTFPRVRSSLHNIFPTSHFPANIRFRRPILTK